MSKSRSPSALTTEYYSNLGYKVEVTERFIPGARIRKDLLGFIDFLCFKPGEVLAVQATSWSNISSRVNKIESDDLAANLALVRSLGWGLVAIGWKKDKQGAYIHKLVDLS